MRIPLVPRSPRRREPPGGHLPAARSRSIAVGVDDPVRRHAVPLKEATLREAIVTPPQRFRRATAAPHSKRVHDSVPEREILTGLTSQRNAPPGHPAGATSLPAASAIVECDARCTTSFLMSGRRRSPRPQIATIRCIRALVMLTPRVPDPDFRDDDSTVRSDDSTVRAVDCTIRDADCTVRNAGCPGHTADLD